MQGPLGYRGATPASSGDSLVSPSIFLLGERRIRFFCCRTKPVQSQAGPPALVRWPLSVSLWGAGGTIPHTSSSPCRWTKTDGSGPAK